MKPSRNTFLLLALGCCVTAAQATPSVELRVTGTLRPVACTPMLSSDGLLDYGVIITGSLNRERPTLLPSRQLTLTVDCSEPARVALGISGNRALSRVPGLLAGAAGAAGAGEVGGDAESNFGLGMDNGNKIGGYLLSFDSGATADGRPVASIISSDQGRSWQQHHGALRHAGQYFSFSDDGATPSMQKILTTPIRVRTILRRADELPIGQELQLDGAATIELHYL